MLTIYHGPYGNPSHRNCGAAQQETIDAVSKKKGARSAAGRKSLLVVKSLERRPTVDQLERRSRAEKAHYIAEGDESDIPGHGNRLSREASEQVVRCRHFGCSRWLGGLWVAR